MSIKRNTIICALLCMCIAATVVLAGCGSTSTNTASEATTAATVDSAKTDGIDYMALVNKTHKLPDDWEEHLETVHMTKLRLRRKPMTLISSSRQSLKKKVFMSTSTPRAEAFPISSVS